MLDAPIQPQQPIDSPPRMFLVSGDAAVEGALASFCRQTDTGSRCVDKPVQPQSFPIQAALTTLSVEEGAPVMIRFSEPRPIAQFPELIGTSVPDAQFWEPATSTQVRYRIDGGPWNVLANPRSFPTPGSEAQPSVETEGAGTIEFDVRWDHLNASYVFQMESIGEDQRSISIPLTEGVLP